MAKEKNSLWAVPGLAGETQEGSSSPQLPGLTRWPWRGQRWPGPLPRPCHGHGLSLE